MENSLLLVILKKDCAVVGVIYADQQKHAISELGAYPGSRDERGCKVIFVPYNHTVANMIDARADIDRLDEDQIFSELESTVLNDGGTITMSYFQSTMMLNITLLSGLMFVVKCCSVDDSFELMAMTAGHFTLKAAGECNTDTLERITRKLEYPD